MANWIIEDKGFGGVVYKCSNCGESWNEYYSKFPKNHCVYCGEDIDRDKDEYIEDDYSSVDVKLNDGESGYSVVGDYIRRYWEHNIQDTVIVSIGTSYDGNTYEFRKEVACPINFDDIEFLYDWWEGEKFIRIYGIKSISEIDVFGGIYED